MRSRMLPVLSIAARCVLVVMACAVATAGAYAQRSPRGELPGADAARNGRQEYQDLVRRARAIGPRLRSSDVAERQKAVREWAAMKTDLRRWSEKYGIPMVSATLVDGQRYRGSVPAESRVQVEFSGLNDASCSETAEFEEGKSCTLKQAYVLKGKLYCIYECPETEPKDPDPPKRPGQ